MVGLRHAWVLGLAWALAWVVSVAGIATDVGDPPSTLAPLSSGTSSLGYAGYGRQITALSSTFTPPSVIATTTVQGCPSFFHGTNPKDTSTGETVEVVIQTVFQTVTVSWDGQSPQVRVVASTITGITSTVYDCSTATNRPSSSSVASLPGSDAPSTTGTPVSTAGPAETTSASATTSASSSVGSEGTVPVVATSSPSSASEYSSSVGSTVIASGSESSTSSSVSSESSIGSQSTVPSAATSSSFGASSSSVGSTSTSVSSDSSIGSPSTVPSAATSSSSGASSSSLGSTVVASGSEPLTPTSIPSSDAASSSASIPVVATSFPFSASSSSVASTVVASGSEASTSTSVSSSVGSPSTVPSVATSSSSNAASSSVGSTVVVSSSVGSLSTVPDVATSSPSSASSSSVASTVVASSGSDTSTSTSDATTDTGSVIPTTTSIVTLSSSSITATAVDSSSDSESESSSASASVTTPVVGTTSETLIETSSSSPALASSGSPAVVSSPSSAPTVAPSPTSSGTTEQAGTSGAQITFAPPLSLTLNPGQTIPTGVTIPFTFNPGETVPSGLPPSFSLTPGQTIPPGAPFSFTLQPGQTVPSGNPLSLTIVNPATGQPGQGITLNPGQTIPFGVTVPFTFTPGETIPSGLPASLSLTPGQTILPGAPISLTLEPGQTVPSGDPLSLTINPGPGQPGEGITLNPGQTIPSGVTVPLTFNPGETVPSGLPVSFSLTPGQTIPPGEPFSITLHPGQTAPSGDPIFVTISPGPGPGEPGQGITFSHEDPTSIPTSFPLGDIIPTVSPTLFSSVVITHISIGEPTIPNGPTITSISVETTLIPIFGTPPPNGGPLLTSNPGGIIPLESATLFSPVVITHISIGEPTIPNGPSITSTSLETTSLPVFGTPPNGGPSLTVNPWGSLPTSCNEFNVLGLCLPTPDPASPPPPPTCAELEFLKACLPTPPPGSPPPPCSEFRLLETCLPVPPPGSPTPTCPEYNVLGICLPVPNPGCSAFELLGPCMPTVTVPGLPVPTCNDPGFLGLLCLPTPPPGSQDEDDIYNLDLFGDTMRWIYGHVHDTEEDDNDRAVYIDYVKKSRDWLWGLFLHLHPDGPSEPEDECTKPIKFTLNVFELLTDIAKTISCTLKQVDLLAENFFHFPPNIKALIDIGVNLIDLATHLDLLRCGSSGCIKGGTNQGGGEEGGGSDGEDDGDDDDDEEESSSSSSCSGTVTQTYQSIFCTVTTTSTETASATLSSTAGQRVERAAKGCTTSAWTTVTGDCSLRPSKATSSTTVTTTTTETPGFTSPPRLCNRYKCGGSSCPVKPGKPGSEDPKQEPPSSSTTAPTPSNSALSKRGDPDKGDWVEPGDYNGDRVMFMAKFHQHKRTHEVPLPPNVEDLTPEQESAGLADMEDMEMTTSKVVPFKGQAIALGVQGLYGCTSVIVLSKRGAWMAHIYETKMGEWFWKTPRPNSPDEDPEFVYGALDSLAYGAPAPGAPPDEPKAVSEFSLYGLKQLFNGGVNDGGHNPAPGDLAWTFGGVGDDAEISIILVSSRPRQPDPIDLGDGTPNVPDEVRLDPNLGQGTLAYKEGLDAIREYLENEVFRGADSINFLPIIDYAPKDLRWEDIKEYKRMAAEEQRLRHEAEQLEDGAEKKNKLMDADLLEMDRNEFLLSKNGDPNRVEARGKLLVQYQPAKSDDEMCRDKASWRLWIEDRPLDTQNHVYEWEPEDYQWWDPDATEDGQSEESDEMDLDDRSDVSARRWLKSKTRRQGNGDKKEPKKCIKRTMPECSPLSGCGASAPGDPMACPLSDETGSDVSKTDALFRAFNSTMTGIGHGFGKRGDPAKGDWTDPSDNTAPWNGNRDLWMAKYMDHGNAKEVPMVPADKDLTPDERAQGFASLDHSMTTSNIVEFADKPVSLGVRGLYGCTSVVVVSNRGVWASHIYETGFVKWRRDSWASPYHDPYFRYYVLYSLIDPAPVRTQPEDEEIAPPAPNVDPKVQNLFSPYGLGQLFNGGGSNPAVGDNDRLPWMFGGEDDDADIHVYLFSPQPRPPLPTTTDGDGNPIPPDSVRLDRNYGAGEIKYNWELDHITKFMREKVFAKAKRPPTIHPYVGYAVRQLEWKDLKKQYAYNDKELELRRQAERQTDRAEKDKLLQQAGQQAYQAALLNYEIRGDVNRENPRGKLLVQYQPAKAYDNTCRDKASWRIWFEDAPLDTENDVVEWDPEEHQWFDPDSSTSDTDSDDTIKPNSRRQEDSKKKPRKCTKGFQRMCTPSTCGDTCPRPGSIPETETRDIHLLDDNSTLVASSVASFDTLFDEHEQDKHDLFEDEQGYHQLSKRGDPDLGNWVTWDDWPYNYFPGEDERRAFWMSKVHTHKGVQVVPTAPANDPDFDSEMTTSSFDLFMETPVSIAVTGLAGCTSIIAVSKRGAWVAHIWENSIRNYEEFGLDPKDTGYTDRVKLAIKAARQRDDEHLKIHRFGLGQLFNSGRGTDEEAAPDIFGTMFGSADDEEYDQADVHVFIVMPRPSAPDPELSEDGVNPDPPDSERLDRDYAAGELRYEEVANDLDEYIRNDIFSGVEIKTFIIDYAPVLPEWELIKTEREYLHKHDDAVRDGKADEAKYWQDMATKLWADRNSDPDGRSPRGKLLVQYRPAHKAACRYKAEWRLFFEERPLPDGFIDSYEWDPQSFAMNLEDFDGTAPMARGQDFGFGMVDDEDMVDVDPGVQCNLGTAVTATAAANGPLPTWASAWTPPSPEGTEAPKSV